MIKSSNTRCWALSKNCQYFHLHLKNISSVLELYKIKNSTIVYVSASFTIDTHLLPTQLISWHLSSIRIRRGSFFKEEISFRVERKVCDLSPKKMCINYNLKSKLVY